MKFRVDITPFRTKAEERVNQHFDRLAQQSLHRDQEHQRKREAAKLAIQPRPARGIAGDGNVACPEWFDLAATVEGKRSREFALEILSKPDELALRGIERRKLIVAIRSAGAPADIDRILAGAGLSLTTP